MPSVKSETVLMASGGVEVRFSESPPPAASSKATEATPPSVPAFLEDPVLQRCYKIGAFLGKGGFAWCYEAVDTTSRIVYALKIVRKSILTKPHHTEKVLREISIHRQLRHSHIVRLYSAFEDVNNIYMVLEYCSMQSLVHVMKKRGCLTEEEVRYYLRQLISGVRYLHEVRGVLHRDLKLGNMLLSAEMEVKIADFGLAAEFDFRMPPHHRSITLCGTPNYIAPEILKKQGHSIATEAWAVGCIMYAMLVGSPPFETNSLDDTYNLILDCNYHLPDSMSFYAKDLIRILLDRDAQRRTLSADTLHHPFFTQGYVPPILSPSCAQFAPSFSNVFDEYSKKMKSTSCSVVSSFTAIEEIARKRPVNQSRSGKSPVSRADSGIVVDSTSGGGGGGRKSSSAGPSGVLTSGYQSGESSSPDDRRPMVVAAATSNASSYSTNSPQPAAANYVGGNSCQLSATFMKLHDFLFNTINCRKTGLDEEEASLAAVSSAGVLLMTKWIDYSNKDGFGFQLNNGVVSVVFNDARTMLLSADRRWTRVVQFDCSSRFNSGRVVSDRCVDLTSKEVFQDKLLGERVNTMHMFASYMDRKLNSASVVDDRQYFVDNSLTNVPYSVHWRRYADCMFVAFSDGSFQVNFMHSHIKLVLSPQRSSSSSSTLAGGVVSYMLTFVDSSRTLLTYPLPSVGQLLRHPLWSDTFVRVCELLRDCASSV